MNKKAKKKSFGTVIRDVYTYNNNINEWRLPKRELNII